MITLRYGRCNCSPRVVFKRPYISTLYKAQGYLHYFDINKPTIVLNVKDLSLKYDYINIVQVLDRYYFVDKIEVIDSERIKYYLRCDLLYTFYKWVGKQYVQVNECQEFGIKNKFLSNRNSVFDVRPQKKKIEFSDPNKLDKNGSLIMITIKGSY